MCRLRLLLIIGCFFCLKVISQDKVQSVEEFQHELNEEYKNPDESPLKNKAKHFEGHDFFPIDTTLQIKAKFVRTLNAIPFRMKTTTERLPVYEKYGEAVFKVQEREFTLSIYQSHMLRKMEKYKTYLFLPFTDLSNGEESYGGGRFIDLEIPNDDTIVIDFNKAYNPYCAYNVEYSCPIPPEENHLDIKILAGVQKPKK